MARLGLWTCLCLVSFLSVAYGQKCSEGQETRRNNMYHVCRNGFQVPVACSTIEGIRVEPGATYRTSTLLYTCQQPHPQAYTLVPTSCIRNGQLVNIGSTVTDGNFWFTCTRDGNQLVMNIGGCVGEQGNRVGPNGILTKGTFLMRCSFSGNNVALEPYGCIVDGSHYPAGQVIIAENFWYECSVLPQGGLELKLSGCVDNGVKVFNGSTVIRNRFILRCDVFGNQVGLAAVGCLDDRSGHHMIGETWTELTSGSFTGFVMECKKEQNRIYKQPRQCFYQGPDGQGALDPNCVRRFGTTVMKCVQRGGSGLLPELYRNTDENTFRTAINQGFRQC